MIQTLSLILVLTTLVVLSWIDYKTFRLPDTLTLPLMMYGLLGNTLGFLNWTTWNSAIGGAMFGFGCLYALNVLYKKIKGMNGVGMGDAKLLGALGALLGWEALPHILLIASLSGLLGGYFLLKLQNRDMSYPIPFGPFISLGGIITLLWLI